MVGLEMASAKVLLDDLEHASGCGARRRLLEGLRSEGTGSSSMRLVEGAPAREPGASSERADAACRDGRARS